VSSVPTALQLGFNDSPYTKGNGAGNGESELTPAVTPAGWPESIATDAFHGLAGEFVDNIISETESDPVALLVQFLAGFGNVVGHSPYFMVEATPHFMNLFALMVGTTAKARKGTSWSHVKSVIGQCDLNWGASKVQSGLSSGEGLIETVRDPKEMADEEPDHGVSDKRLLVLQTEFSTVLAVMARAGNTLSSVVRDAWDHGNLSTMCRKANALRATGAHVSVLAHITRDEVRRNLTDSEMTNGFANRFLWICVRRSKLLPEGGHVQLSSGLVSKLRNVIERAQTIGQMERDDNARKVWRAVYPHLTRDIPGMLGSVTARAEAQVLRLSCIYALLDASAVIREEHLRAAMAVWTYAEESARYIFGDALGDPVADSILAVLRERKEGVSRTEIRDLFGRHKSATRIQIALDLLVSMNKAHKATEQTGGRPVDVWFATAAT
jgi:hypothetical protein